MSPPSESVSVSDQRRLERLIEVGRALVSELDPDVVLDRVLETARELSGARYAAVGVLDERGRELARFLTSGVDAATRARIGSLPRGRGILGVLIDDPRPLRLHDVSEHPRSYGFPQGHPPMHSFLGVPIIVRGEAWGNLYLAEKEHGDFDEDDEHALVVLADWAAIAIENARSFRASEQRRAELERAVSGLEATMDIAQAVGGETSLDRVLELIAKRARAIVEADTLLILRQEGDELVVVAAAGRAARSARGGRVPVAGSSSGRVLARRESQRVDDAHDGLLVAPEHLGVAGARTALLVPLLFRGRSLGVLAAFDHLGSSLTFGSDDERALRAFAASAATAVASAKTVEEQRLRDSLAAAEAERRRWARELHDETLQGLGGLKVLLSGLRRRAPAALQPALDDALDQVTRDIGGLRETISDLRPAALDELGLEPALRGLTDHMADRHALRVPLDVALGDGRLAPELETLVYRVVQESLSNVAKHAHASRVEVRARAEHGLVRVQVRDDGIGFDPDAPVGGYGLAGMRERVALADGTLDIAPGAPGTVVEMSVPIT